jgi:biopolymer transport protein ExbD
MKILKLLTLLISVNLYSQDVAEPTIEELRNNEINILLELVKTNKSIYVNEDNIRLNSFLERVAERTALLNDAKKKIG